MELREELLSELPAAQNGMFLLFLICFFVSMILIGNSGKLLPSMLYNLFRETDRQSIFSETIDNEAVIKMILSVQTVLLSSVIIQCIFLHACQESFQSVVRLFQLLGGTILLIIAYFVYKFLANLLISSIFFPKESRQVWHDNFFSIISLSGLVLFIPALGIFYIEEAYYPALVFCILYFLFVQILTFYKIFIIFFQQKSALLYFILYLCAQELVPLFLVYKALIRFYGVT